MSDKEIIPLKRCRKCNIKLLEENRIKLLEENRKNPYFNLCPDCIRTHTIKNHFYWLYCFLFIGFITIIGLLAVFLNRYMDVNLYN